MFFKPGHIELNIPYGKDPLQQMDIYFPSTVSLQTPVLFYVHGGGFIGGSKDNVLVEVRMFAELGYVTVNLNYRLVDGMGLDQLQPPHIISSIKIADQIADIGMAVNKFKSLALVDGLGDSNIFMVGHSAGGTLAMLYVQGELNKDNFVKASANLAGLTSIRGAEAFYHQPPVHEPQWLNMKELVYRLSGVEFSKDNEQFLKAISADCLAAKYGGKPNISIMPISNDEDIQITPFISSIRSAESFNIQLRDAGVMSEMILMNTDHDFKKNEDDWDKAVKSVSDFFMSL